MISCALTDDEDDHPPICEDCTNPAPEAAIPTGSPAEPNPDPRPLGGYPSASGGYAGNAGRGGAGGTAFGPFTGGASDPFGDTGGSSATGGTAFGFGGTTFGVGGSNSFAGNAAFGGI